jgi:bacterioferritin (cytochrome b1)
MAWALRLGMIECERRDGMAESGRWDWWRDFLGRPEISGRRALEILTQRYVQKSQHAALFRQHAERMQYPQFRDKLLAVADDEAKHVEWLAEKIKLLGGRIPDVSRVRDTEKSSWQYLMEDLTAEQECAAGLIEQAQSLRDEVPSVADLLERIYQDGEKHRESLRQMLMRSDPQSHLAF